MSQDKPDFLYRWKTEPKSGQDNASLPAGFSERMSEKVMEAWGISLALEKAEEEPEDSSETSGVLVSLDAWKKNNPRHPKVLASTFRSGRMDAPLLKAVGHGAPSDEDTTYRVGDLITLDIQTPEGEALYIAILLRRADESVVLAYPYGPDDVYRPMQRLELEWEVEPGPNQRTFLLLFSEVPLVDIKSLKADEHGQWTLETANPALLNIEWANVKSIEELPFQVSTQE